MGPAKAKLKQLTLFIEHLLSASLYAKHMIYVTSFEPSVKRNLRRNSENKQEKTAKGTETLGSNPTSVKNSCMVIGKLFNLSVPQFLHLGKNLCCACLTRFGMGRNKMMSTKQIEQMPRVLFFFLFRDTT